MVFIILKLLQMFLWKQKMTSFHWSLWLIKVLRILHLLSNYKILGAIGICNWNIRKSKVSTFFPFNKKIVWFIKQINILNWYSENFHKNKNISMDLKLNKSRNYLCIFLKKALKYISGSSLKKALIFYIHPELESVGQVIW